MKIICSGRIVHKNTSRDAVFVAAAQPSGFGRIAFALLLFFFCNSGCFYVLTSALKSSDLFDIMALLVVTFASKMFPSNPSMLLDLVITIYTCRRIRHKQTTDRANNVLMFIRRNTSKACIRRNYNKKITSYTFKNSNKDSHISCQGVSSFLNKINIFKRCDI